MSAGTWVATLGWLVAGEVDLPGTQPNELNNPVEPTTACNCHLSFSEDDLTEPGQSYRATAMSLSARDPLFRAALAVASRDRPELSDLCIRCHAPTGWLGGRSTPGDGSALLPDDLESVTCDTCHRMIPTPNGPQLIGSGQYSISPSPTKRARRGNGPLGGHVVEASDFIGSAEMCGACHSLFNPAESAHDPLGQNLGFAYYEQRTYEEWKDSDFSQPEAAGGKTCITCHMQRARGRPARQGMEYDDMAVHMFVGSNDFVALAVNLIDPLLDLTQELPAIVEAVDRSLRSAAKLTVTSTLARPAQAYGLEDFELSVRLENLTGHKLPTGYPEGRRVYLEVELRLPTGSTIVSGAWDRTTGNLIRDPQLRTYETEHGRVEGGTSTRTHHLIEMNQILTDTRIPPRGFRPSSPDMAPYGRDYGSTAPYRHWDDVTFRVPMPFVTETITATVTVRAKYQLVDGVVVDFLTSELGPASLEANNLTTAWESLGKLPPKEMASVSVPLVITQRPPPPPVPPGPPDPPDEVEGGCSCAAKGGARGSALGLLLVLLFSVRARPSRCR